jgi:hypothetical protein
MVPMAFLDHANHRLSACLRADPKKRTDEKWPLPTAFWFVVACSSLAWAAIFAICAFVF